MVDIRLHEIDYRGFEKVTSVITFGFKQKYEILIPVDWNMQYSNIDIIDIFIDYREDVFVIRFQEDGADEGTRTNHVKFPLNELEYFAY